MYRFWMTTGSMLMCSNTSPAMISVFVNAWDRYCPFFNPTIKLQSFDNSFPMISIYACCCRGRHVIIISIYKTNLLVISEAYCNHINLRCTLCIDIGGLYRHQQQLPIRIFNTIYSKAVVQWTVFYLIPSVFMTALACCCVLNTFSGWCTWFMDCVTQLHHSTLICIAFLLYLSACS